MTTLQDVSDHFDKMAKALDLHGVTTGSWSRAAAAACREAHRSRLHIGEVEVKTHSRIGGYPCNHTGCNLADARSETDRLLAECGKVSP